MQAKLNPFDQPRPDKDTKLLLHFDGVDGATTTVDDSIYGKTVTLGGDAQIDTAQSKFGGSSCLFDGTGDYASIPDSADWDFGTGDFTVECWYKRNALGYRTLIAQADVATNVSWIIFFQSNDLLTGMITTNGTTSYAATGPTITDTNWHHVALVRSGNTLKIYSDGVVGSVTSDVTGVTVYSSTGGVGVGRYGDYGGQYWSGHIDEVRVSKGIARWTSNFTPPTAAYPSDKSYFKQDQYTKLLLHCDGTDQGATFTDSSIVPKTVSTPEAYDSYSKLVLHLENNVTDATGSKTVTNNNVTFSSSTKKFSTYSGVFNGTNAYLSVPDSADWYFGTGDFTIDFWVNFSALSPADPSFVAQDQDGNQWWDFYYVGGSYYFGAQVGGSYVVNLTWNRGSAPSTGVWYHLALVRSGNNWYLFENGTAVGSTGSSSGSVPDCTGTLKIGSNRNGTAQYVNGYIDEFRISKGIARWTSNFTPPRSAYGIVWTVTGEKKFGTASAEIKNGSGGLTLVDSADWNFGSGNFTIDFWVYLTGVSSNNVTFLLQDDTATTGITRVWYSPTLNRLVMFNYGANYSTAYFDYRVAYTLSLNTWTHLAFVRSGKTQGNWKIYVNGVAQTQQTGEWYGTYDCTMADINASLIIGEAGTAANGSYYLDELRISKGIARWTADFTPPTIAYKDTTEDKLYPKINFPGFQEIADFTSDGTETRFDVPVDGDTDKEYQIDIRNPATGDYVVLRLNNDTGSNYGRQYIQNASGSVSASRSVDAFMYLAYYKGIVKATLLTPTGFLKTLFMQTLVWNSGTTVNILNNQSYAYNSTSNITTLNFLTDSGAAFTSGTRITVYARRSQT